MGVNLKRIDRRNVDQRDYRQSRMPRCHGRPKAVYRRKQR